MATNAEMLLFISLLTVSLLHCSNGLECHCSQCPDALCTTTAQGACFTSRDPSGSDVPTVTGCLPESLVSLMCVQSDLSFTCCRDGDHCNTKKVLRVLRNAGATEPTSGTQMDDSMNVIIAVVTCVVVTTILIALLAAGVGYYLYYKRQQRKLRREEDGVEGMRSPDIRYTTHSVGSSGFGNPNYCRAILPQSESIGSLLKAAMFYGDPLSPLVQRSIVQQTHLEKTLYKGAFCTHYIGKWREDRVGVKVYMTKQERVWLNEKEILQLPLMRNENILGFLAADSVIKNSQEYHFLINEHHSRGTLREYLTKSTVEVSAVLTLATSLVNGLEYIHSELQQQSHSMTVTKPAIAHRNISSQSIYVDKSGSCVWGDFSLAVKNSKDKDNQLFSFHPYGDVRYLPPEFLGDTPPQVEFEELRRGDVYAVGLVLWEICQCCLVEGSNEEYSLPYFDLLASEDEATPTREEMRNIVCDEKKRPHPPDHCTRDQNTRVLLHTMQECWSQMPSERPSSQQLKNSLEHSLASGITCHITLDKNGQPVYKQTLEQP